MTILRKGYLFVAALFVFSLAPAPAEAQEVVCGWCQELNAIWAWPDGTITFWGHRFPGGGNGCPGLEVFQPRTGSCARCGGTSTCHFGWDKHRCHILCGPAGGDFAAVTEIEEALTSGDMTMVAAALNRDRDGLSVEFVPEAGRVDFILACDPDRAFRSIPLLPEVRERLKAQLAATASVMAMRALGP